MGKKQIDLENRTQYYDNASEIDGFFKGHLRKRAVRLDDNTDALNRRQAKSNSVIKKEPKDSLIFGDLFRSLVSKKSNYFTYLNKAFVGV